MAQLCVILCRDHTDTNMAFTIKTTDTGGRCLLTGNTGRLSISIPTPVISYSAYNSTTLLDWPSTGSYTVYSGGFTQTNIFIPGNDEGYTNTPIILPVAFSTNNQSSTNLYVSTNGYFTLGSGANNIDPYGGPYSSNPATMGGNVGDNVIYPGAISDDGDAQNIWYTTGSVGDVAFVKLIVLGGRYGSLISHTSWTANFYRDVNSGYQWYETRVKSAFSVRNSTGPYNAVNVLQSPSTTSRVWRGDLNGQNWVYMGTGSVII